MFQPFTYSVSNGIYAGVGMSLILFFTTGAFVDFLPGAMRQKEDLLPIPEHRPSSSQFPAETSSGGVHEGPGPDPAATSPRTPNRGLLRRADSFVPAVEALEAIAGTVGLDRDVVRRRLFYKLGQGGARNVEGHWLGGVPASEAQLALLEAEAEISLPLSAAPFSFPSMAHLAADECQMPGRLGMMHHFETSQHLGIARHHSIGPRLAAAARRKTTAESPVERGLSF